MSGDVLARLSRIEVDPGHQEASQARFVASVDDATLSIAYTTYDGPLGTLLVARTSEGLVRVAFLAVESPEAVLADLARAVSPRILRTTRGLDDARRDLDAYFAGTRRSFESPLDLRLSTGFRREVLGQLCDVGYGTTVSYSTLAAASGRPRAVRATASACATNPLPIIVPCHRVVRSDGSLGGYLGGLDAKRALLALEGVGHHS